MPKTDPRVDKRRVTMTSYGVSITDKGPVTTTYQKVDYVRPDFLEAYVANARTVWQTVEVSDEPDAGPGGYDGETYVPQELDHPLAGKTFAATAPSED